jgi:hypothetical protein
MNVQEVLNISKERTKRVKIAITKLVENIHKKILYHAKLKKESCTYTIPPLVDNVPLYDREYIIKEIFKTLDAEGYIVTAYPNGQIDINWNEKLVEQKVKTDSFVLSHEERKLKNITRKVKQVDARFNFLANHQKMASEKELSIDDQLNIQVQKILREKESLQNKFKKLLK